MVPQSWIVRRSWALWEQYLERVRDLPNMSWPVACKRSLCFGLCYLTWPLRAKSLSPLAMRVRRPTKSVGVVSATGHTDSKGRCIGYKSTKSQKKFSMKSIIAANFRSKSAMQQCLACCAAGEAAAVSLKLHYRFARLYSTNPRAWPP